MARILKFNSEKADELIVAKKEQIAQIDYDIDHLVDYTIKWYDSLKEKYGSRYPRLTEVRSFDTIEATKVVEANEKLYINKEEGFIGTSLKKDEFVCNCSDIDDIILFYRDGKYKVVKVSEKMIRREKSFTYCRISRRMINVRYTMRFIGTERQDCII